MNSMQSRLGSAQVRWNDYVGTAAADDADAVLDTRSLYEIAGLDRDRWTIVGIDFTLDDAQEIVVIYAADRDDAGVGSDEAEEMPVTAFHLAPSTQLSAFLREAFKRISVRLLSSVVADKQLLVADRAQLATD
jgi:hypothetical protein